MKKRYAASIVIVIASIVLTFVDLTWMSSALARVYAFLGHRPQMNMMVFIVFILIALGIILPYKKLKVLITYFSRIAKWVKDNIGKIIVSSTFFILFIGYFRQEAKIDVVGLCIVLFLFLPWVYNHITSVKLPGGFEIGLRDIPEARKLVSDVRTLVAVKTDYNFQQFIQMDPSVGLVSLRIEIENRLRLIAKGLGYKEAEPLGVLFNKLRSDGTITERELNAMEELITAGNSAAHGKKVEKDVADWASNYAPMMLNILDEKVKSLS